MIPCTAGVADTCHEITSPDMFRQGEVADSM
jgi:hypothetical protein